MRYPLMGIGLALVLIACGPGEPGTTIGPGGGTLGGSPSGVPGGSTTGIPGGVPAGTTPTDTRVDFDCSAIALPVGIRHVPGAKGYHDVDFDTSGNIIGANGAWGSDLVKADNQGNQSLWIPNVGTVQQMVQLPTGDLAIASESFGIVIATPQGATTVLNPNIRPYGLILGPDEMLYAADQDKVHRVDYTTGLAEVIVPSNALANGSPRVINFNLDFTKLMIGTYFGSNGRIYEVELDPKTLDPISPPVVFASGVGSGSYHDTLGVDICGFIYVADYSTSSLNRISPSGTVVELFRNGTEYPHGMEWGTGADGWLDTAIYLSQPYNNYNVIEIDLGIPSRDNPNYRAINLP